MIRDAAAECLESLGVKFRAASSKEKANGAGSQAGTLCQVTQNATLNVSAPMTHADITSFQEVGAYILVKKHLSAKALRRLKARKGQLEPKIKTARSKRRAAEKKKRHYIYYFLNASSMCARALNGSIPSTS